MKEDKWFDRLKLEGNDMGEKRGTKVFVGEDDKWPIGVGLISRMKGSGRLCSKRAS